MASRTNALSSVSGAVRLHTGYGVHGCRRTDKQAGKLFMNGALHPENDVHVHPSSSPGERPDGLTYTVYPMHTQHSRHIQSTQGEPIIVVITGTYITSSTTSHSEYGSNFFFFSFLLAPIISARPKRVTTMNVNAFGVQSRAEHKVESDVVTAKVAIVKTYSSLSSHRGQERVAGFGPSIHPSISIPIHGDCSLAIIGTIDTS
jgi:hypothetical protein